MTSQPDLPSPSTSSPSNSSPVNDRLDHINIPYDNDNGNNADAPAPAQLPETTTYLAPDLLLPPARNLADDPHPFGILHSVHLRRLAGRDARHAQPAMEPAAPARVTRRDDFPTVKLGRAAAAKGNNTVTTSDHSNSASNNDNQNDQDDNDTTTTPPAEDRSQNQKQKRHLDDLVHRAMKPTFPPHLDGVVETRHRSDARITQDLAGFEDVEDMVGAKVTYGKEYRAIRGALHAAERALIGEARAVRAVRGRLTEELLRRAAAVGGGGGGGVEEGVIAARLGDVNGRLRGLAAHLGLVYALGRAVDQAVFPGKGLGRFDEMECSPKAYLMLHFPEFVRRPPAGPVDPMAPDLSPPPHLLSLFYPVWDVSLEESVRGEKRARLRRVWKAAAVGDWQAVGEMTRGETVVVEDLVAVGGGGGDGDGKGCGL